MQDTLPVAVQVMPPGVAVTVYLEMAPPPSFAGGVQVTKAEASRGVATGAVGASGRAGNTVRLARVVLVRPPPTPVIWGAKTPGGVTVGTFEVVIVRVEVEPLTGFGLNDAVVPPGRALVRLRVTGGTNSLRLIAIANVVVAPRMIDWLGGVAVTLNVGL